MAAADTRSSLCLASVGRLRDVFAFHTSSDAQPPWSDDTLISTEKDGANAQTPPRITDLFKSCWKGDWLLPSSMPVLL